MQEINAQHDEQIKAVGTPPSCNGRLMIISWDEYSLRPP
jgi:hypothetical protein